MKSLLLVLLVVLSATALPVDEKGEQNVGSSFCRLAVSSLHVSVPARDSGMASKKYVRETSDVNFFFFSLYVYIIKKI